MIFTPDENQSKSEVKSEKIDSEESAENNYFEIKESTNSNSLQHHFEQMEIQDMNSNLNPSNQIYSINSPERH